VSHQADRCASIAMLFLSLSLLQQQMLVSRATPGVNTRYEWVQEAYEQLTLCKYDGRPHTGKNWDRTFTNPRCG